MTATRAMRCSFTSVPTILAAVEGTSATVGADHVAWSSCARSASGRAAPADAGTSLRPGVGAVPAPIGKMHDVPPYPDWLEFHYRRIGGPVANVRSRSGLVRVEAGEHEFADEVLVGIPDDDAWSTFSRALDLAGFWDWPDDTHHDEPHKPGDWYWWLEVRGKERRH